MSLANCERHGDTVSPTDTLIANTPKTAELGVPVDVTLMKPLARLTQHDRADHHNTISSTVSCGAAFRAWSKSKKLPFFLTISLEDPEDLGAGDGTDLGDAIRVTKDHTDLQRQEKSIKKVETGVSEWGY